MSHRGSHDAALRAHVALEALKGGRTMSERTSVREVHPPMIHQSNMAFLNGAAGLFERAGKAAAIAEDTVCDLHVRIEELAVAKNFFLVRPLNLWTGR